MSGAPLRFHLLRLLWNAAAGCPFRAREIEDVLSQLYGDEDPSVDAATEDAFRDLRYQTNKRLRERRVAIRVRAKGGKVWLDEAP